MVELLIAYSPNNNHKVFMSSKKARNSQPSQNSAQFQPLQTRTPTQERYLAAIKNNTVTIAVGPAGTGKSYVAASYAAEQLFYRRIDKLILSRPIVEAGETLGFLPGDLDEKYQPYIAPFREILDEKLGKSFVDYLLKTKAIEAVPMQFMRGRTFKNCVVILDEAQNATQAQIKLLLTRLGEDAKCIMDGDLEQMDLPTNLSGLGDALKRLKGIPSIATVEFHRNEVVRSKICSQILQAYDKKL